MDWDTYFITMSFFVAMKSKDQSSKVGAVIVGPDNEIRSTGYNGLPRGVQDNTDMHPERHQRPTKYFYYEHGERNAIYNAARMGTKLAGCKIYTPGTPCADCARGIIQSGITEVITYGPWDDTEDREKWQESSKHTKIMLEDSNVHLREYSGSIQSIIKAIRGGKNFEL